MGLKMNPPVFKELRWPKQAVAGVHKCTDPLCPHPLTERPAISLQRLPQREKGSHFPSLSSLSHLTRGKRLLACLLD